MKVLSDTRKLRRSSDCCAVYVSVLWFSFVSLLFMHLFCRVGFCAYLCLTYHTLINLVYVEDAVYPFHHVLSRFIRRERLDKAVLHHCGCIYIELLGFSFYTVASTEASLCKNFTSF